MKRYVYVPINQMIDGTLVPEKAEYLSKKYHIPIRIGSKDDDIDLKDIDFISIPDSISIIYSKVGTKNLVNNIDYVNDFLSMNKKYKCKFYKENYENIFYPNAAERHCLKFKIRINQNGLFNFVFLNENDDIISEEHCLEIVDWE